MDNQITENQQLDRILKNSKLQENYSDEQKMITLQYGNRKINTDSLEEIFKLRFYLNGKVDDKKVALWFSYLEAEKIPLREGLLCWMSKYFQETPKWKKNIIEVLFQKLDPALSEWRFNKSKSA